MVQYYGHYYRSMLHPVFRPLDQILVRWACRKYKKLRGHQRRAAHWLRRISVREPKLWTLWRSVDEVIPELNRLLKGWDGYFHCGHSTRVFDRMNHFVANRLQRGLWRKSGCARNLWTTPPREVLQQRWGLYRLPTWAAWKRASS